MIQRSHADAVAANCHLTADVAAHTACEPYRAPWWLPGGNAQTVWAAIVARRERVRLERARWDTPDGDFVLVDFLAGPERAPFVVLFHGLEGGADSHYAEATMAALARHGWRGAIPHFRGCGGEMNRLPRAYHSGDADEIEWMLERFSALAGGRPLFAAGVSLGGNALLKWLANRGDAARAIVRAAVAVSAPIDLAAGADALERGFARVYARMFLRTLKRKVAEKARLHPGQFDLARARATRTLREFDDLVTAPLHGFRDAADYYARASAKPGLGAIRVPTLVLNALNDPFLPGRYLPAPRDVSPHVTLEYPATGGHVGFVGGPFPGRYDWLPRRILAFFSQVEHH
ncbi:MAG TPA: alpha/beta fold hydrolase [Burkholderiales bacterium]|nr:alpha/beta fold hydrolase [Burkholderiales bacterium]